jgi:MFS transporter, PAT family, beta-lactamase induction signal transducer AmpG
LLPIALLYLSSGATLATLSGATPLILRARGLDLAGVGMFQLVVLPLGLSFCWASLIDRLRWPFLSHRTGWIVAMQAVTVGLIVFLAHGERWPLACLIAVAFLGCATLATVDVALEALVVETVGTSERALTATAKQAGATVGSIIGLSLLIFLYAHLGWHAALLILAGLNAAATLPILCYHEARRRRAAAMVERSIGSVGHRLVSRHVFVLAFYFASAFALAGPTNLALLDLGVALPTVAFLFGTVGPATNIAVTLLVGPFVMRIGTPRLITLMTIGMTMTGILMLYAFASDSTWPAFLAVSLAFVCSGALFVPIYSIIYRWAQGTHAALDVSLLLGATFLATFPLRVAAPALAGAVGWTVYFAIAVPFYGVAAIVLREAVRRTEIADGCSPASSSVDGL